MFSLQDPIQKAIHNSLAKKAVVESFWPVSSDLGPTSPHWESYFSYYTQQCYHALHGQGSHILHRSHQDIINAAEEMRECNYERDVLKSKLKRRFTSPNPREEEILDNSVDLVARLLLMINVRDTRFGVWGQSRLRWESGSLQALIYSNFNDRPFFNGNNIKLERSFTAVNMDKISGIQLCWTDNLMDHLRLVDDDDDKRVVAIFHHSSFLHRQRNNPIFPPGLIDETMRTLALLFPQQDKATQKWLKSLTQSSTVDTNLIRLRALRADDRQIEKFAFWHNRLILLKQAYDESSPKTMQQWWNDRRNGVQWWTFWIACLVLALTFIFGLTQSIEGGLQVARCTS